MLITKQSPFTGKTHTIDIPVTEEQLARWRLGAMIQDAMPNLTSAEREFLMTGITPEEWALAFGEEA